MGDQAGIAVVLCGILGLAFASFGNVVIHRLPLGQDLARPPSACPRCATPIKARDNVPVLGWLLLRGRCRSCGEPISPRYPLVELAGALLSAAVGLRFGLSWVLPGYLVFVWVLLVVSAIDVDTRKIPNKITYPGIPALLVLLGAAAFLHGQPGDAVRALVGGAAAFAFMLVIALINPRGMGLGDVKLAAFIGIGLGYLGLAEVVVGLFASFLAGGVIAVGLLATGLRGRKDALPFGPYLAIGAIVSLFAGTPIAQAYLGSIGLGGSAG